jgi:hypothetical protein
MSDITKHGEKRTRKRLGISKKGVESAFAKAILEGKRSDDFKGAFKKYLDFWCISYHSVALVHDNSIFFMKHGTLITAWPIPQRYRKYLKDKG